VVEARGSWPNDEDLPVRPVLRAFEQVADQLREMVLSGRLSSGQRLPTEAELCERFSVSRSTVREALRTLATEGLVRTARGASGGTFVAVPQTDAVVDFLTGTFSLMAGSREVTVLELLEARELLEVPAARMSAAHRTDGHIDRLHDAIVLDHQRIDRTRLFEINRAFHEVILIAAPNRLLRVMTAPLFTTLHSRFLRDRATPDFWDLVMADHTEILAAVVDRDPDAAAEAMARHLRNLRPTYEHIDALHAAEHAEGLTLRDASG
jgi:GntR family transcriptional regulator, transcriptional repressor for pyruvate dehydrogenase complex